MIPDVNKALSQVCAFYSPSDRIAMVVTEADQHRLQREKRGQADCKQ